MREEIKGIWAMIGCAAIWGVSGIYYKVLDHVPAVELIAHRTIWGAFCFGLVIALQGRAGQVRQVLGDRHLLGWLALAAALVSVNWTGFVLSVHMGWALEASLGYYILPLFAACLGVVVLREPLAPRETAAVVIAALAVVLLGVGLGATPWMALLLASTFAAYGLIKRRLDIGPVLSVFMETLLLSPLALIYLAARGGAFGADLATGLLLMGAGPLTAVPLILFAYASRRLRFATLGLVSYLNPSLQFAVAALVFKETVSLWHAIALPMIWLALALYSYNAYQGRVREGRT